jgi:CubicO group peptidase (beta-lactamase class C family)
MMVAHLHVPAIDNTPNLATTLSKKAVSNLLKKDLGFDGLIFTDALNMKGASKYFPPGEVDLKALLAGNDVLLFPENVGRAVDLIEKAMQLGNFKQKELDRRVRKILSFKYWSGLDTLKPINTQGLEADLHTMESKALVKKLYISAVTVARNQDKLLPLERLDTLNMASLSIGLGKGNEYQKLLQNYAPITLFEVGEKATQEEYSLLLDRLGKYNLVLVDLHKMTQNRGNNYGISASTIQFLNRLNTRTKVVLALFGNPYSLKNFVEFKNLIVTYEDNETTRQTVPQVIFGALPANGKLPVTADPIFKNGMGLNLRSLERLQYGIPEEVQISSKKLARIDSLVKQIIKDKATPGCQVLVARNNMVVYNKGFGHMSYDSTEPVDEGTLYDLASITKTAATLQAVMYLQERGQIDVNMTAANILPEMHQYDKGDITVEMLLLHQTGMQPFIPFWKRTKQNAWVTDRYYCNTADDWFKLKVSEDRYAMRYMEDSLWKWTLQSERGKKNKLGTYDYKYSDMNFYILKRLVETILEEPIDEFLNKRFYKPLGMHSLLFRPLEKYPPTAIAPTEQDDFFRKTLIRGYVHDQGAAMIGGVGGHAGLFSNANSLAILTQMNLNKGYYGGKQFLLPQTIPYFTRRHSPRNRRGYGWDKPYMWTGDGPTSDKASKETFGHTGFTGTCVWADPKYNLIYIFLSNRVHPDAENNKLAKNNIRPRIHDLIYEALTDVNFSLKPEVQ